MTQEKSLARELAIGFGLGFLTNLLWAIISAQFNPYIITAIFVISIGLYYAAWAVVLKPLRVTRKAKIKDLYGSYKKAKPAVNRKLLTSTDIRILTIGGGSIAEDERGGILDILSKRVQDERTQIKILLANPRSEGMKGRLGELDMLNPGKFDYDGLRKSIEANAQKILARSSKIQVRFYDMKPVWRIFILDELAFVSSYLSDKEGHETQVVVLEKGSDLFRAFERTFDILWQSSSVATSQ